MRCLKCGTKTQDDHVFCDPCLSGMRAYPIKPGTVVQIPSRVAREDERKTAAKRPEPTPNERIRLLRGTIRWLLAAIAVLLVVLGVLCALLIYTLDGGFTF